MGLLICPNDACGAQIYYRRWGWEPVKDSSLGHAQAAVADDDAPVSLAAQPVAVTVLPWPLLVQQAQHSPPE